MRTGLLTAATAAMLMLSLSASAEARGPHRHGCGMHHRCYATAIVPTFRTVQVERTTTLNRTSRPERKLMAVAYIQKNGYLSVGKYCGFSGAGLLHFGQKGTACEDGAGQEDSLHIGR